MVCVRHKDFTLRDRNKCVELDTRFSLALQRMPSSVQLFRLSLETSYCSTTESHLFHDLITQFFLRSLQCGIVVMGVIDAFVYAQNHHHRNIENPSNFGDCTKGRVRFMTAITPSYAHLYQLICLTGHIPATLHSNFPLPAAKARYAHILCMYCSSL